MLNVKHIHIPWLVLLMCQLSIQGPSIRKTPSDAPPSPFLHGCRVVFSELNFFSNDQQFIELTKRCSEPQYQTTTAVEMDRFKILFISHNGYLLGMCHLTGRQTGETWFYVVGKPGTPNLNHNIENCQFSTPGQVGVLRFPEGIQFPLAIALVRNDRVKVLEPLALLKDTSYRNTVLTKSMETKIMANLQDFYITGSYTTFIFCEYFKKYYTNYKPEQWVLLRDWSGSFRGEDRSLNRCDHVDAATFSLPMQPKEMRHSTTTIGAQNDCEHAFRHSEQPQLNTARLDVEGCYTLFANHATQREFMLSSNTYQASMNRAANIHQSLKRANPFAQPVCYYNEGDVDEIVEEVPMVLDNNVEVLPNVQATLQPPTVAPRIIAKPVDPLLFEDILHRNIPYLWNDCSRFPNDQLIHLQRLPHNPIDVNDIYKPETCNFIEYVIPKKKLVCKLCKLLLQQKILVDRPGSPLITDIMTIGAGKTDVTDSNSGSKARSYNRDIIQNHKTNPLHLIALEYFRLFDEGKRGSELKTAFEAPGGLYRQFLQASENVIIAVIQSTKMGISFSNYKLMAETLDYFGVTIGSLYQNYHGMQMGIEVVGQTLHAQLVKQLKDQNLPFSVTLDTATDVGGYANLAVLFQTFSEDGNISVYLYRVIHIPGRETGENLFNTFMKSLEDDDLTEYAKSKTSGLTTDGHPALLSVFRKMFNAFVNNELIYNHCQCHRLELLNKNAYNSFDYLRRIDIFVNTLFTFFNSKAARRKQALRDEAVNFGVHIFEPKQIKEIRWISSKLRAISPIITRHSVLVDALDSVSEDDTFRLKVRADAESIAETLRDGTVLATVSFLADINSLLSDMSLKLQLRGSSVIGTKFLRTQLQEELEGMKTEYGKNVRQLLQNSEIVSEDSDPSNLVVTLPDFETKHVKYGKTILNVPNPVSIGNTLHAKMEAYIEAIFNQFENYFPDGEIGDKFDVFWAGNFPEEVMHVTDYGAEELAYLNQELKWQYDNTELKHDWENLVRSLIQDARFGDYKNKQASDFWSFYLKQQNIMWTPKTTQIIQRILTVPATSAEAERIFSIYTYTKTLRRFSLLPKTVENIIRIRFNGKANIKEWNTLEFAKALLEQHSRPDDSSRRTTWAKRRRVNEEDDLGPELDSDSDFLDESSDNILDPDSEG